MWRSISVDGRNFSLEVRGTRSGRGFWGWRAHEVVRLIEDGYPAGVEYRPFADRGFYSPTPAAALDAAEQFVRSSLSQTEPQP